MTSDVNAEEGWRDQIPSVAPARDTGDSEWEYEYDENDTEVIMLHFLYFFS